jgi:hypothetical protein
MSKKPTSIYQLKISLKGSKPLIWRRLEVAADIRLSDLHDVIQTAMGWFDCHLHHFAQQRIFYSPRNAPDGTPLDGFDDFDEAKFKLHQLLKNPKQSIEYLYDMGDSWRHAVTLEKILEPQPDKNYPLCSKGSGACPPEDCGGIWGYQELLKILSDPSHPEYEDMLEWNGEINPDEFDLESTNTQLSKLH